jgi:hypothetical protein
MKSFYEEVMIVVNTVIEMLADLYDVIAKFLINALTDAFYMALLVMIISFVGGFIWHGYIYLKT